MNNILSYIQTLTWFHKLLIFIVFAMATAWVFRLLTPTQVDVQQAVLTNVANVDTSFDDLTFTGTAPEIPAEMTTATLLSFQDVTNTVRDTMIEKFQLSQKPNANNIWESSDYTLSVTSNPERITFFLNNQQQPSQTRTFSPTAFQEITNSSNALIAELFPENPPQLLEKDIRYLSDSGEPTIVEDVSEAELLLLPYLYQTNGYPIYLGQETAYVAYFLYNPQNQIVKAEIRPYTLSFESEGTFKSLDIALAMSNINADNAALIFTDSYGLDSGKTLYVSTGALDSARIEYRADPVTDTIIPYYHFYGVVTESPNPDYDINAQIITPAIQTNFDAADQ